MKQEFLTYKNSQISFYSEGKGSAVVLLHGFLENSSMWKGIVPELSKKNRVICVDLLGHGYSGCIGYEHSMEDMAESVIFVLKKLRLRKALFIGHSMGGYVSLALAEQYPAFVKGICLLNSTSQADGEERKKLRLRAIKIAKTNYENLVSMSIANLFSKEILKQFYKEIESIKEEALKTPLQGYIACSEGMRLRLNREAVLIAFKYKKLLILGEKDVVLSPSSIVEEALRTNTPCIKLLGGHMSVTENLSELLVVLKEFVCF